jgi:phosphatidylserine/phosphatidylglycerophosphate/cardiolipin synthase-like enzyme
MHNKVFLVDDMIGITGGRNYENTYYDQSTTLNFKDRDALLTGPAVSELAMSFQDYWHHQLSVDIAELTDVYTIRKRGEVQQWNSKSVFALKGWFNQIDAMAEDVGVVKSRFIDSMVKVEHAAIIADAPGKNGREWFGRFRGAGDITIALAELLSNAQKSILIQTPYLVLSGPAIDLFREIRRRHPNIDIRISTNSLAATDSWHTYAISYQQKQTYLRELEFIIYEFKPYPGNIRQFMPQWDILRHRNKQIEKMTPPVAEGHTVPEDRWKSTPVNPIITNTQPMNEPYLCLHAKSMIIDDKIAFIGSYNLDPRSENLNTEIGLVIEDRSFARMLKENILIDTRPENAWVIARNDYPAILEETNAVLDVFSQWLPIIDPWPIRYAGSYELKRNKTPVDPNHSDFYNHYRYVGNFPEVGMARIDKIMGTWLLKSIGSITKPLL